MITIDLIGYRDHLHTRKQGDTTMIYCNVRKKWIVLTPEEVVRQLFILYCTMQNVYPIGRISVEKEILVSGLRRRYDIAIHDAKGLPAVLVECKAPHITLDQNVLDQVARYNSGLGVSYILVTNGMHTYGFHIDVSQSTYSSIEQLPAV